MYCPKCNQQQVAEEMRFCSRCGFPLAGVALLLENNGMIPELPQGPAKRPGPSRKKIMVESAIFTVVAWVVSLVAVAAFDFGGPFEVIAMIAALLFAVLGLIGLIRFLYGFLFAKDVVPNEFPNLTAIRPELHTPNRFALPPQQSVPISDYPRRSNTKDMLPQPSVTENTTRLLEEQLSDRGE